MTHETACNASLAVIAECAERGDGAPDGFNDRPRTTLAQVIDLLDSARLRLAA